jgi:hypothetical protein
MDANWQNVIAVVLVLIAAVFVGRQMFLSARAFFASDRNAKCPPGCSCGRKKQDPD